MEYTKNPRDMAPRVVANDALIPGRVYRCKVVELGVAVAFLCIREHGLLKVAALDSGVVHPADTWQEYVELRCTANIDGEVVA